MDPNLPGYFFHNWSKYLLPAKPTMRKLELLLEAAASLPRQVRLTNIGRCASSSILFCRIDFLIYHKPFKPASVPKILSLLVLLFRFCLLLLFQLFRCPAHCQYVAKRYGGKSQTAAAQIRVFSYNGPNTSTLPVLLPRRKPTCSLWKLPTVHSEASCLLPFVHLLLFVSVQSHIYRQTTGFSRL
jgi:hypothetical protein